jgi:hypothetical protein
MTTPVKIPVASQAARKTARKSVRDMMNQLVLGGPRKTGTNSTCEAARADI